MQNQNSSICRTCFYRTERLAVAEWHDRSHNAEDIDLPGIVAGLLTEPATRSLPPSWQGPYTVERARKLIEDRDTEGTTLLVRDRASSDSIGLIILFETAAPQRPHVVEVRLGYLLAEPVWGKGYASEMIEGLIGWCREQPRISSLAGGVERGNAASKRVLERCGFRADEEESHPGEEILRLTLRV